MRIVQFIFFSLVLILVMSCGNRKQTVVIPANPSAPGFETPPPPPPPSVDITYVGVIALDKECGYVIEIKLEDKKVSVVPTDLEETYHRIGMRVRLITSDKLDENKKCGEHYKISIKYITPLRG